MQQIIVFIWPVFRVLFDLLEHAEVDDALTHDGLTEAAGYIRIARHFCDNVVTVLETLLKQGGQISSEFSRIVFELAEPFDHKVACLTEILESKKCIDESLRVQRLVSWFIIVVLFVVSLHWLLVLLVELQIDIVGIEIVIVALHHLVVSTAVVTCLCTPDPCWFLYSLKRLIDLGELHLLLIFEFLINHVRTILLLVSGCLIRVRRVKIVVDLEGRLHFFVLY